jgi:hypothetical protein
MAGVSFRATPIVLSPEALASNNVMDEVSYALEEEKLIVPILFRSCAIPFRLRRVQYIDFTASYRTGFSQLLRALHLDQPSQPREPAAPLHVHKAPPEPPTTAPAKLLWMSILLTTIGWLIADIVSDEPIGRHIALVIHDSRGIPSWALGWSIGGAVNGIIGGCITGMVLRRIDASFRWKHVSIVSMGWAFGGVVGGLGRASLSYHIFSWHIRWTIGAILSGIIGGCITGMVLRRIDASFRWQRIGLVSLGWACGGVVGGLSRMSLGESPLDGAVIGAIGSSIVLWQFLQVRRRAQLSRS